MNKKAIFISIFAAVLVGCKTKTVVVEVERVRTDTTYIAQLQRDSIWLHDSIHVREKGDTVWMERWHTKYIERLRHDTLYRARIDSVPVPYPVEKLVPRQLTWWQRTRLHLANIVLLVLLFYAGTRLWKFYKKLRP